MREILNNPQEYPILSQWNEEKLSQTIETLTKQANPSTENTDREPKTSTANDVGNGLVIRIPAFGRTRITTN